LHRGSAYRELTLRTVQQNKPRLRRALKPIVPADIGTDDQLPITLAIAVPVKPVIARLRRERTGSRRLFDRCSSRGDCACILAAKDISKGRASDGGDRNAHGVPPGNSVQQRSLVEHDLEKRGDCFGGMSSGGGRVVSLRGTVRLQLTLPEPRPRIGDVSGPQALTLA